tara:strand:- start:4110 stop:4925 length:816 start_codon:yes stop_codon:yes gene_type:complete
MPYIGTQPLTGQFKKLDAISVVNGQPNYTLNYNGAAYKPATANALLVSVNGVIQAAGDAYTISGSTITFTENLVTGDVIDFIIALGDTGSAVTPVDGSVTTAKIADDAVTSAKLASGAAQAPVSVAVLSHVTAYDTGGGDLTSGAYRTRPLNTEVDPDSIVTLSSNQFTLVAGTYTIDWTCDAYKVDHHWSQIYDITNSATLILGSASYAGSSENIGDVSYGHHIFTITSTTTYELQQQSTTTKNTNGMGNRTNVSGNNSIHAYLKITKLA